MTQGPRGGGGVRTPMAPGYATETEMVVFAELLRSQSYFRLNVCYMYK